MFAEALTDRRGPPAAGRYLCGGATWPAARTPVSGRRPWRTVRKDWGRVGAGRSRPAHGSSPP